MLWWFLLSWESPFRPWSMFGTDSRAKMGLWSIALNQDLPPKSCQRQGRLSFAWQDGTECYRVVPVMTRYAAFLTPHQLKNSVALIMMLMVTGFAVQSVSRPECIVHCTTKPNCLHWDQSLLWLSADAILHELRSSTVCYHDQSPVYTVRVCQDFLHTNAVDIMHLPNRSRSIWTLLYTCGVILGLKVTSQDLPNNAHELCTIQDDAWNAMP